MTNWKTILIDSKLQYQWYRLKHGFTAMRTPSLIQTRIIYDSIMGHQNKKTVPGKPKFTNDELKWICFWRRSFPKMTLVMLQKMWSWKVQTRKQWGEPVPIPSIALDSLFTCFISGSNASCNCFLASSFSSLARLECSSVKWISPHIFNTRCTLFLSIEDLKDNTKRHQQTQDVEACTSFPPVPTPTSPFPTANYESWHCLAFGSCIYQSISEYIWKCLHTSECLHVSMSIPWRLQSSWLSNAKDCNFKNFWFHVDESNLAVDQILNVNTNSNRRTPRISQV